MSLRVIHKVWMTEEQHDYLVRLVFENGTYSVGGSKGGDRLNSVQWCIETCMKIEELYGIDAGYIAYNDIRIPENDPTKELVFLEDSTVENGNTPSQMISNYQI